MISFRRFFPRQCQHLQYITHFMYCRASNLRVLHKVILTYLFCSTLHGLELPRNRKSRLCSVCYVTTAAVAAQLVQRLPTVWASEET
jgi:hypothetical protein